MFSVNLRDERLGMINENRHGSKMEIIKYNRALDILVKFEKGSPIHTNWDSFIKGTVKSPYDKSVYSIAYLGEGDYKTSENGKITR